MARARIESIDVARGIAALSVTVYHHGVGAALAGATGWGAFRLIGWPGATIAVPFFFVISGFCIHLGGLSQAPDAAFARRFYLQRLIRIYPAWLVAVAISALVHSLEGKDVPISLLFSHLTLANAFVDDYRLNAALWSVSVEWFLYLLYPFWLLLRKRFGLKVAALVAGLLSALSCLATHYFHPTRSGPALWFFLNVWCGWVAGAVLAELWTLEGRARFSRPSWWVVGATCASVHVGLVAHGSYTGPWQYLSLPITICLFVWPLALLLVAGESLMERDVSASARLMWKGLAGVGAFSYSLYLLHIPIQSIRFLVWPAVPRILFLQAIALAAWLGLVLWVSFLSYRWVELPTSSLGRRILRRSVAKMAIAQASNP